MKSELSTFGPLPCLQLLHIGRDDAHGEHGTAMLVDDGGADRAGFVIARRRHHAGARLDDDVLRLALDHGPRRAPAGAAGIDQAGIDRLQRLVAEAEPVHHAAAVVLHHDVDILDEVLDDGEPFFGLEVHGEGLLVAEGAEIEAADAADMRARPAPRALARQGLDLDDVGAEVAQILRAGGTLQDVAEAEDLHRFKHRFSPIAMLLSSAEAAWSSFR